MKNFIKNIFETTIAVIIAIVASEDFIWYSLPYWLRTSATWNYIYVASTLVVGLNIGRIIWCLVTKAIEKGGDRRRYITLMK